MNTVEPGTQNFTTFTQMVQVGPAEMLTGIAIAHFIKGPGILSIPRVAQLKHPGAGKDCIVASVAGRHDTVEHIDPQPHCLDDVSRFTHPH